MSASSKFVLKYIHENAIGLGYSSTMCSSLEFSGVWAMLLWLTSFFLISIPATWTCPSLTTTLLRNRAPKQRPPFAKLHPTSFQKPPASRIQMRHTRTCPYQNALPVSQYRSFTQTHPPSPSTYTSAPPRAIKCPLPASNHTFYCVNPHPSFIRG